ncbi:MAG: acyl-CoA reductase [Ferruginibacter sp.]
MILQERIELMVKLGSYLRENSEEWNRVKEEVFHHNGWFTPEFTQYAAEQIAEHFLQKEKLTRWTAHYHIDDNIVPKNIGIIMAGNIPMVGFHDMLAVFISGHHQTIKLSSKDDILLKHMVKLMTGWNPESAKHISFADMLRGADAYIATGSNNSANAFEEYFGKYPSLIRRNRTSVAILTGNETSAELEALSDDIHLFFGLGCRNVTKIYAPKAYDFVPLIHSFHHYKYFADHHKYKNNFDYQLSILLLNNIYYMSNEATLLTENKGLFSPVSQVWFEYYTDIIAVKEKTVGNSEIQCIAGKGFQDFGSTQQPGLFDYADGVDTMQFLLGL